MTTQEIIKNHILGEIFCEFPTDLDNGNAFDFFLRADVDCTEDVTTSPLGHYWGYEVCEEYGYENIRSIRGLMQSMYDDLEKLKTTLFKSVSSVKIYRDEMDNDDVFDETAKLPNAILKEQGTENEHILFYTVSEEVL